MAQSGIPRTRSIHSRTPPSSATHATHAPLPPPPPTPLTRRSLFRRWVCEETKRMHTLVPPALKAEAEAAAKQARDEMDE